MSKPDSAPTQEMPETIQARLLDAARERPLASKEQFDLAVAFLRSGAFVESLTTARLALGTTTNDLEKAAFYALISQNQGAMGNFRAAAEAALNGQRFNPTSKELAALRLAYFDRIGDLAQRQAAEDTLAQLGPSGEKITLQWSLVVAVVKLGEPIIQALAETYEKWYEADLIRRHGGGNRTNVALADKLVIVADGLAKLWPLVSPYLPKDK